MTDTTMTNSTLMHQPHWMLAVISLLVFAMSADCQDPAASAVRWNTKQQAAVAELAERWWRARPATKFEAWDPQVRAALAAEAVALGGLPEGVMAAVVEVLWAPVNRFGPGIPKTASGKRAAKPKRPKWLPKERKSVRSKRRKSHNKATLATPYGEAWFHADDGGGKEGGLVLGLHGGGRDAGSADEPRGSWILPGCVGFYPQGIRLVDDTWNTVHGERFLLTMIEIGKAHYDVDPDRVYSMGFSMGGTGSWFMAGRHADLLAGAAPCAGVVMADPKAQLETKEEVRAIQHGLIPNVRNLAMYYYIGLADRNCMPGTYLFVADRLDELRAADPGGYNNIKFTTYPGLGHSQPPGEPKALLASLGQQRRVTFPDKVVWEYATDPFPQREADDEVGRLPKTMFYWIGCTEARDQQRITAVLDKKANAITLSLRNCADAGKGITLFLNDQMIDVTRPVVVRDPQGKVLWEGSPKPDLWTVLETLDARVDRKMVFDRRIAL
jgi:pimeloyl-ACP methyl ester carboxylesterase